jgi:hypothetical protein
VNPMTKNPPMTAATNSKPFMTASLHIQPTARHAAASPLDLAAAVGWRDRMRPIEGAGCPARTSALDPLGYILRV